MFSPIFTALSLKNLTLLHSKWPKLHRVLAILSVIGLNIHWFVIHFHDTSYKLSAIGLNLLQSVGITLKIHMDMFQNYLLNLDIGVFHKYTCLRKTYVSVGR